MVSGMISSGSILKNLMAAYAVGHVIYLHVTVGTKIAYGKHSFNSNTITKAKISKVLDVLYGNIDDDYFLASFSFTWVSTVSGGSPTLWQRARFVRNVNGPTEWRYDAWASPFGSALTDVVPNKRLGLKATGSLKVLRGAVRKLERQFGIDAPMASLEFLQFLQNNPANIPGKRDPSGKLTQAEKRSLFSRIGKNKR